ncbi:prealbumin-like fold domain-containing protein [Limosilactobacillus ingluviei]|uniref:prealbumin-like fold domain-containing protein n=1 Tax=Limosilactobacillus ingluviei TaxID=148604 RepID=UPI0024BAD5A5|nr:prealbumin-like fold domain-containing protein [Limosilactobacillus ingluviei]
MYDQSWRGKKVGGITPWQGANWGVYLNSNHAQLAGPIDLSDEIPAGLALDPTTVTLTVDGQTSYRMDEIATAYPASQLTVTGNRLQAHLSAAEFSGHQVLLGYLTRILTTAGTELVNQVTGTYQLPGQAQQGFTYQTQVRNIAFDATVTGVRPGNLKIIKQYQDGVKRKTLAEATFVIINPVTTQVWVEKTNAQGIIELTNVPAGTYVVREIAAPAFIDLTKVKDQEWQIKVSASEAGQALVIVNEKKPVDEVDQGTGTDEATTTDPVETTDAATEGTPGVDAGVGTDEILTHDEGTSPEPGVEVGADPLEVPTVDAGSQTEAGSVAVGTQTDAPDQSDAGTATDDLMIDENTGTDPIDTSDATTEMASGVDAETSTEPAKV